MSKMIGRNARLKTMGRLGACLAGLALASLPGTAWATDTFNFTFTTTGTGITRDGVANGQTTFTGQLLVSGGTVVGIQNAYYGVTGGRVYKIRWEDIVADSFLVNYTAGATPSLTVNQFAWNSTVPSATSGALYTYTSFGATQTLSYTDSSFATGDSQSDGLLAKSATYVTPTVPEINGSTLPLAGFVLATGLLWLGASRRRPKVTAKLSFA